MAPGSANTSGGTGATRARRAASTRGAVLTLWRPRGRKRLGQAEWEESSSLEGLLRGGEATGRGRGRGEGGGEGEIFHPLVHRGRCGSHA